MTTSTATETYETRLMGGPISSSCAASHLHYLQDSASSVRDLASIADAHADKFTTEEIAVLAAARRILSSKRVPMALLVIEADAAPLFL